MIITPEGIDIWSTIVWGIATAAIGGIIVVSVSGNLTPGRAISRTLIVFVACAIIWIGYYNVPGYSMFYLGNFVSSSQKNCSLGIDYWVRASKLQPRLGLAYLQIGQCYFLNGSYETAIEWL